MLEALAAVVRNGLQLRTKPLQLSKIVHHRVADVAVQAALALARRVHVPHTELLGQQPLATNFIAIYARSYWTRRPNGLQNLPEMVLRVPIVLLRRQRGQARETAQDEQARAAGDDRWQAGQHGINPLSLGKACSALAVVASASASADRPRRLAT